MDYVTINHEASGWVIRTDDESKDALTDFLATENEINQLMLELELSVRPVVRSKSQQASKNYKVADMKPGWLFHSGDYWYRMVRKEGRDYIVLTVGDKTEERMKGNILVSEISVLCLT